MDHRLIPANARVAAAHLRGKIDAPRFVEPQLRRVIRPLVDLLSAPHGRRERQLIYGEAVRLFEARDGWAFVQCVRDDYVGYVAARDLEDREPPTHRVSARSSHIYSDPDFKSHERLALSQGALLRCGAGDNGFLAVTDGYVPAVHLQPVDVLQRDPVAAAEHYLGTPYLWGGNSIWGIDCSGLVQAACLACGIACPGDSDQQQAQLGRLLPANRAYRRGDLLFWRGHVALVAGRGRLLHANAHSMTVTHEDLQAAITRIAAAGDGPVTAHKRLPRRRPQKETT